MWRAHTSFSHVAGGSPQHIPGTSVNWRQFGQRQTFIITAEWNDQYYTSSLRSGWRFAQGSGINNVNNTDNSTDPMGTILPMDCRLIDIRWFVGNVGSEENTTSFQHKITKNETDLATLYSWTTDGSGGDSFSKSATPNLDFSKGDRFNLRLTSPSGYSATRQIGRVRVVFTFVSYENIFG